MSENERGEEAHVGIPEGIDDCGEDANVEGPLGNNETEKYRGSDAHGIEPGDNLVRREETKHDVGAVEGGDGDHIEKGESEVDDKADVKEADEIGIGEELELDAESQQEADQDGECDVGSRTGDGNEGEITAGIVEIHSVDGDGFGPAEGSEEEENRSERIEMRERVEAQSTRIAGSIVAFEPCNPAVGELMNGEG